MKMMMADIFRLLKGKMLYIVLGIIISVIASDIYIKEAGNIYLGMGPSTTETMVGSNDVTIEPVLGIAMAQNSSVLYIPILFMVFTICLVEFNHNTVRNTIISPMDKRKYYLTKLGLCFLIVLIFYILYIYGGYFLVYLFRGSSYLPSIGDMSLIFIRQIPIILGMTSILVMLSFLLKKTASYITITLLMASIFQMSLMLLEFINTKLHFISYNIAKLCQYEFMGLLNMTGNLNISNQNLWICLGLSAFYLIASTFIGMHYFNKKDLK